MNDQSTITQSPYPVDDSMSLKDMILMVKEYWAVLWSFKWWVIAAALLMGAFFYYRAYKIPTTYTAQLTFALNEGESSGMSGISGLLGQFGLGGGSSGKVSLDKIVELSRSMRIVNKAAFEKVIINDKEDFIANHIIDLYHLDNDWAKGNKNYIDFRFKSDSLLAFTKLENAALKGVYGFLVGSVERPGIITCSYDKASTIFSLASETIQEDLSLFITQNVFNHLSTFYIQQSSDKQKQTFELVKAKADSIYNRWTSSEYTISNIDETSGGLWAPTDRTQKTIQTKKSNMYAIAYGEALKNMEIADFAVKNSTPFIREIDRPFAPLDPKSKSRLKQLLIGMILGGAIATALIFARKIYLEAVTS